MPDKLAVARSAAFAILYLFFIQDAAWAQESGQMSVGIRVAPPFVMKDDQGNYSGISIELWQQVASELQIDYEFRETELTALFDEVQSGALQASVGALTLTAEREEIIDFTHPFYSTGLSIAVPDTGSAAWRTVSRLWSWEFLMVLGVLTGLLLLVGTVFWLAERRHNSDMFGGGPTRGIGASFWWAAVTMTTVGYGDKAPITFVGRLIALIWMFAAVIIISSFTAAIATSLTVNHLESTVRTVDDLPRVRVATVTGSVSAQFLQRRNIAFTGFDRLSDSLKAMDSGKVDAVVYDRPILLYLANRAAHSNTVVLPNTFERQDYALVLPEDSPLRESVNLALLRILATRQWQTTLTNYLGEQE